MLSFFLEFLKVFVAVSIFFVWVPRYHNIVEEFKTYQYPDWLRDIVGILKLTCAALLVINIGHFNVVSIHDLYAFQKQFSLVLSIAFTDNYECIYFLHDV